MKLTPQLLISAYSQGVFPMAYEDGEIYWFDPDPRAIIPLDDRFHIPRSLARKIRQGHYEIRVDTAFREVIEACAELGPGRETTWINQDIVEAYTEFHSLGFAHSVETWINGELAGGLYGVAIGGFFAGESMFSRISDSSKLALVYLVERLRRQRFQLLDTQFMTDHLRQFGTVEIPRREYKLRLARALKSRVLF